MKKYLISIIATTTLQAAFAAPISQMSDYEASNVSSYSVDRIWNEMETSLKGKDCYRRAHIWAYDMYRNDNIYSKKIFIHYTDKWNKELDNMGGRLGWLTRRAWSAEGLDGRTTRMVRSNITWDYHVAPMIVVDGKDKVMDRYLDLAYDAQPGRYSESEAWKLYTRPSTPSEWVEALTVRGELLWKARKYKLKEQGNYSKMRELGMMDEYGREVNRIDIKCQKIDSIAQLDKNHYNAWCFWSESPMYYYNEIDLRFLAYGNTGYRYSMAVPQSAQTEENYQNGREYIQYQFNENELRDAQRERK